MKNSEIFVELNRGFNNNVTLYFRRKDRAEDGLAFFCIAHHDHVTPGGLFDRCSKDSQLLKVTAVRSNSFFHTGNLECGFSPVTKGVGRASMRNVKANTKYDVALVMQLDGDAAGQQLPPPFIEDVELKELKEKSAKLVAYSSLLPHSPWKSGIIPSLICVQVIAHKYYQFLSRISHGAARDLEHRLTILGVSDTLCGDFLRLVQSCFDIRRLFSKKVIDTPPGTLLEGVAALGSPAAPTMKGPWTIDWFDFLLLVFCERKMYRRLHQVVEQFKLYEKADGHTVFSQLVYMLKPDSEAAIPAGTMAKFIQDASPIWTPARATWTLFHPRQQFRAFRYVFLSQKFEKPWAESLAAQVKSYDLSPLTEASKMLHMQQRYETLVKFVDRRRLAFFEAAMRRARCQRLIGEVLEQKTKAEVAMMEHRFCCWRFWARMRGCTVKALEKVSLALIMRKTYRRWYTFCTSRYLVRLVPVEMLPMPKVSLFRIPAHMNVMSPGSGCPSTLISRYGKAQRTVFIPAEKRHQDLRLKFTGVRPSHLVAMELLHVTQFRLRFRFYRLLEGFARSSSETKKQQEWRIETLSAFLSSMKGGAHLAAFMTWKRFAQEKAKQRQARKK